MLSKIFKPINTLKNNCLMMHCYNHTSTSKTGCHESTPLWKGLPTQRGSRSGCVLHANVSCHRRLSHYIHVALWRTAVTLDEFECFPVLTECLCLVSGFIGRCTECAVSKCARSNESDEFLREHSPQHGHEHIWQQQPPVPAPFGWENSHQHPHQGSVVAI